jgi:hypothetical protein
MCTLQLGGDEISSRLFNQSFSLSWKNFINMLNFYESCKIDVKDALPDFDITRFWQDIYGETVCFRPCTDEIHDPALRFIHKWLGATMFYREEFRIARLEELTIMYAMTKKKKNSPIKLMTQYWLTISGLKRGAVTCTSVDAKVDLQTQKANTQSDIQSVPVNLTC